MSPGSTHFGLNFLAQRSAPQLPSPDTLLPLLIVSFVGFLVSAVAFTLWRWRKRRGRVAADPSCGRCGYLVKGLTTFTCPECGSDLREVGIVRNRTAASAAGTPTQRSRAAIFFRTVGWQLALAALVVTVGAALTIDYYDEYARPNGRVGKQVIHAFPKSRAFTAVTVTLNEQYTTRGHPRHDYAPQFSQRRVSVELQVGADRFLFVRDLLKATNTYLVEGVERTTSAPLGQEFRDWTRAHGVNVNDPAASAEVDAIVYAIGQADRQGEFWNLMANDARRYFNIDSTSTANFSVGQDVFYAIATSIAVVIGLAALAVVWFLNRKRLATALAARRLGSTGPTTAAPKHDALLVPAPAAAATVRTLSVMFSDVKDYTARAAQESRLGILDLVRRHRELVAPVAKRRGGRIVKSLGDGLLLTFDSATDAVLAGLEIQSAAAEHSRSAFADRDKLELRIAVSTGEVALHDGDVFGEAVNLASRAQQQANPGEVLFTDATWATINRREIRFTDAGTHQLKGLEDPVPLFRALPQQDATSSQPSVTSSPET